MIDLEKWMTDIFGLQTNFDTMFRDEPIRIQKCHSRVTYKMASRI